MKKTIVSILISFLILSTTGTPGATKEFLTKEKYIERIQIELKGLSNFNVNKYTANKDTIIICLALFNVYAELAGDEKRYSLDSNEKVLLKKYKDSVRSIQKKAFPILRDKYGPALRKELWEHNVTVKTIGNGYRTIRFTGWIFAANRNIKKTQESASAMFHQLRFTRCEYMWSKAAGEYTYYTLDSHRDSDLVVWLEGKKYRDVK